MLLNNAISTHQNMNIFGETERMKEVAATAYFEVLTWYSFGGENHEKRQTGLSMSWLRYEPDIF
jgi:hypothetical protein